MHSALAAQNVVNPRQQNAEIAASEIHPRNDVGVTSFSGDERLRVTVKHINAETVIRIDGVGPVSNDLIDEGLLKVYPNPTDGRVTVTGLTIGTTLRLYNAVGTQVAVYTAHDEKIVLDISSLANGLYFLNVDTNTIRIIKK